MKKQFFSILCILSLGLLLCACDSGTTKQQIERSAAAVAKNQLEKESVVADLKGRVGLTAEEYAALELGPAIPVYILEGETPTKTENEYVYPILSGDKMVLQMAASGKANIQPVYLAGLNYIDNLEAEYVVVKTGNASYLKGKEAALLLQSYTDVDTPDLTQELDTVDALDEAAFAFVSIAQREAINPDATKFNAQPSATAPDATTPTTAASNEATTTPVTGTPIAPATAVAE